MGTEMKMDKMKTKMRSRPRIKTAVSLEEYLQFLHFHSSDYDLINLTVGQLNQIIFMYGYKKIHKVAKKVLLDAVTTLTLVDPSRSTLKSNISPLAFATIEDVLADLDELNWQECCVTSIQTLSTMNRCLAISSAPPDLKVVNYDHLNQHSPDTSTFQPEPDASKATVMSYDSVSAVDGAPCTGRRRVNKMVHLAQVHAADGAPCKTRIAKKLAPKRKKSSFMPAMSGGGNSNNALALDCI